MYMVAEVEIAAPGGLPIKSVWKKVPGRIHVGASTYPNRTPEDTAGVDEIIQSDNMLVQRQFITHLRYLTLQAKVVSLEC